MNRSSLTFGSSGSWQKAETETVEVHPLRRYGDDFLAGFGACARDIVAGTVRESFGSFAATAWAAGYRAGVREWREG